MMKDRKEHSAVWVIACNCRSW